ncbi:hypothetical protein Goari_000314, partial [Gossypium aridum]|nr:hypothetical protein [Gossypium aridum]
SCLYAVAQESQETSSHYGRGIRTLNLIQLAHSTHAYVNAAFSDTLSEFTQPFCCWGRIVTQKPQKWIGEPSSDSEESFVNVKRSDFRADFVFGASTAAAQVT